MIRPLRTAVGGMLRVMALLGMGSGILIVLAGVAAACMSNTPSQIDRAIRQVWMAVAIGVGVSWVFAVQFWVIESFDVIARAAEHELGLGNVARPSTEPAPQLFRSSESAIE